MAAEEQKAGEWLDIGGTSRLIGFGTNGIEVRVATGPVGWTWRKLTDDEKVKLLNLWNASLAATDGNRAS